eukprot:INCI4090.4.p1 GENE.INCI4090.4~~INCI4090.4.p1  ORF type:complete len:417 (+),score=74.04 INCI4090.4:79-1329(+)
MGVGACSMCVDACAFECACGRVRVRVHVWAAWHSAATAAAVPAAEAVPASKTRADAFDLLCGAVGAVATYTLPLLPPSLLVVVVVVCAALALTDQAAFTGMAVMQAAAHLKGLCPAAERRSLHLGLGAGTVPSYFHGLGMHADSVERSACVVREAEKHFHFNTCISAAPRHLEKARKNRNSANTQRCDLGRTLVADAFDLLTSSKPADAAAYDVIVADVFMGENIASSYSEDIFRRIRDKWLQPGSPGHGNGILVANVVGYLPAARSSEAASSVDSPIFIRSVKATLEAVFGQGSTRCFRDMPLDLHPDMPSNIACFARAEGEIGFDIPAAFFWDAPFLSSDYVMAHFQEWEVIADSTTIQPATPLLGTPAFFKLAGKELERTNAAMKTHASDLIPDVIWEDVQVHVKLVKFRTVS